MEQKFLLWLLTGIHEDAGPILGLAQSVKDCQCHKLWHRSQMGLGSRIAEVAVYQPLAWELPCAVGMALKKQNQKNDKKRTQLAKRT